MPKPPCWSGRFYLRALILVDLVRFQFLKSICLPARTGPTIGCNFLFEDSGMCSSVFDCNSWFVTQLGWHELVECAKTDSENGNFTNWDDPWNTKLHVISKAYKDTKKLARTILIHVLVIGNLQWWFLAVLEPWSEDLANLTPLFESKNPAFLWNVLATKPMALYPPGCIWSHHEPIRHGYVIEFGSHDQEI